MGVLAFAVSPTKNCGRGENERTEKQRRPIAVVFSSGGFRPVPGGTALPVLLQPPPPPVSRPPMIFLQR